MARVRHNEITDGLPLLGEDRSCNGHRSRTEFGPEPDIGSHPKEIEISPISRLVFAPSSVNGEHFLRFAHTCQRVPTHRQQLLSHSLHGLHE